MSIHRWPSKKARRQVWRSITRMEQDPFRRDVKALQGKAWKGYERKRTDYRIIFFVHHAERLVDIGWVLPRSEKTYQG